jgi:hypothetical protein
VTTVSDILRRAFLSAEGVRGVPTGDDAELALFRFQDLINSHLYWKDGGWTDVYPTGAAYAADDGERVYASSACTVTLPTTYVDEYGETVAMRDLSRVQIIGTAVNAGLWVYSGSLGQWSQANALEVASDLPFGPEDVPGLAAMLAVDLQSDGGGEVSTKVREDAAAQERSFRARLYREVNVRADEAVLKLSEMGYSDVADFTGV